MSGIQIIIIAMTVITLVGIIIKSVLHHRLQDIDGFGGTHMQDQTKDQETIVGYFGDNK